MKSLRVRLDPDLERALDRLRNHHHVNVSAWVRGLMRVALANVPKHVPGVTTARPDRPAPAARAPAAPTPAPPLPDWMPWKLPDGSWGARHTAPASLPSDLTGRLIQVQTKAGEKWTATVLEVVHREDDFVLVRRSGRL